MATRYKKFVGPVKWARVFEDNRDMEGFEGAARETEGQYSIEIGLTDTQMADLKASGSMKKGRAEGEYTWVKFTRPHKHAVYDWAGGEPKVTNAAGDKWDFEDDGSIGNESEAEVDIAVYDTRRPSIKGTRLEGVKVVRLVEMEEKVPF